MTQAERQKRYEQRMKDHGLNRRAVWVPEAAEAEFWTAIEKLRRQWQADGLMPVEETS